MGDKDVKKLRTSQQHNPTDWFQSPLGRRITAVERDCLKKKLVKLFGYYLVQIGRVDPKLELLSQSPVKNRLVLDRGSVGSHLLADPVSLPLATDSVDGVVMHHTLDFSPDPHRVLREAERILIPEGRLLIVGFNPWSLWGVWRLIHLHRRTAPWHGHFFSSRRICDWLSLLGFELESVDYLYFLPPIQNQTFTEKLTFWQRMGEKLWPMAGGVYVMTAIKRSVTMTPIRPKWAIRKKVLPTAVEPTTRSIR